MALALSLELYCEYGLIRLEDHALVHLEVFVQVEPGAVGAALAVVPV